jgi:hypothetical protein
MQRRASAALLIADHAKGEVRLGRQKAREPFDIALLESRGELAGERVVASQGVAKYGHRTPLEPRCDLRQYTGHFRDFTAAGQPLHREDWAMRSVAFMPPDIRKLDETPLIIVIMAICRASRMTSRVASQR